jgi:hypothetical protein
MRVGQGSTDSGTLGNGNESLTGGPHPQPLSDFGEGTEHSFAWAVDFVEAWAR